MSFAVFDEAYYLANYPDVKAAVATGAFKSGLEHFQKFGLAEGRVLVSPFYNEQFYLEKYTDVAAAVKNAFLRSGLQHFIQTGETERRQGSELFDEGFYLQKNPDVAAAVATGIFSSGLSHYLQFGQAEGRSGTNFNEFAYLKAYSDVEAAVDAGIFDSALEHYLEFGQFEIRGAIFNGTSGNDTVIAYGQLDTLYGVDLSPGPEYIGGSATGGQSLNFYSSGINEADVLIGGAGKDTFGLGRIVSESKLPPALPFYRGNGNADFATIKNFEIAKDEILLAGAVNNYDFVQAGDSLNIILSRGSNSQPFSSPDLIATVEGVTSFSKIENNLVFTGGFLS